MLCSDCVCDRECLAVYSVKNERIQSIKFLVVSLLFATYQRKLQYIQFDLCSTCKWGRSNVQSTNSNLHLKIGNHMTPSETELFSITLYVYL